MQWQDWLNAVTTIFEIPLTPVLGAGPTSDPNFNLIWPSCIQDVELALCRDLQLIGQTVTDETGSLTPNSRKFTLPTSKGNFIVVTEVAPIVSGTRQQPMNPVSRSFLDFVWPSDTAPTAPSVPNMFCPVDQVSILVGPAPDSGYGMSVVGEQRFVPLAPNNDSNFLTIYVPDLYLLRSYIYLAGYQREFGAMSDNPQIAQSWQAQYKERLTPAFVEEQRKRFASTGWSPAPPAPLATPPKT